VNMDLISIVVAVYNAEKTLNRCVDSLLAQTYKSTEIILVNDCSKDNSLSICKDYESKFSNVIVASNEKNSGVSVTRNKGIDISTGKYICFVDSDDYVEPDYLQVLYESFVKYGTVPICGFVYHDELNNKKPRIYSWSGEDGLVSFGDAFRLNDELYLCALWNKLFSNELIKKQCIKFDLSLSMGEDLRFSVEYFQKADIEFAFVTKLPLYHYVNASNDSLMKNFGLNGIESGLDNLNLIRELAIKYNISADDEYQKKIVTLKRNFIYFIVRAKVLSDSEKLEKIREFNPEYTKSDLRKEKFIILKEKIYSIFHR